MLTSFASNIDFVCFAKTELLSTEHTAKLCHENIVTGLQSVLFPYIVYVIQTQYNSFSKSSNALYRIELHHVLRDLNDANQTREESEFDHLYYP